MMSGDSPAGQLGLAELRHDRFAVGHLRHVLGRDEADGVDVAKAERDEAREVFYFFLGGDDVGEALPGIARAFDYGDGVQDGLCLQIGS